MSNGYIGKILWVDLSQEIFEEEKLPDEIYRKYIGGYGLAVKLIYDRMEPKAEALSENALFGFFPGLLTGTAAPFSGRYMVAGKSPLTGTWGDANSGGTFGPEIKKCGYDAIIIKGAATTPKYLSLIDGKKDILDANEIWGLDLIEAEEKLKKIHGNFVKTAGIGQAGERLSLISGIANDKGRIAARSGFGAVMGAKNIKALVLKGREKIDFYDKNEFMNHVKEYNQSGSVGDPGMLTRFLLKRIPKMAKTMRRLNAGSGGPPSLMRQIYHNLGTPAGNMLSAESGDSPVKNWDGIGMYDFPPEKTKYISAAALNEFKVREYGCYSCPVQCGAIMKVPELGLEETHLPEYETCSAFGSLLLNNDLMSIFKINDLCNRATIDTISTGGVVAFAIECYENGILTKLDTEGLELSWGNSDAIVELVKKIINREGIGDILADGVRRASQKIGKGSESYAIHSLGQELPMHTPTYTDSLGFSYAFDPTPGRHTTPSIDFTESAPIDNFIEGIELPDKWKKDKAKKLQAQKIDTGFHQVLVCSGLCLFAPTFGTYPFVEFINSLTGWEVNIDELIQTGLRIQNLRQAFTLREGIKLANNTLPGRAIGDPPYERGPLEGVSIEYKGFYKDFCQEMGWNPENGYPLKNTLKDLSLDFVIQDLY